MVHPLPIPVGRTAIRPTWAELPSGVRELIERRLGNSVTGAVSQRSGYTPGFASRLTLADGSRAFVKAADGATRGHFADTYREEIRKLQALPAGIPAPLLRWSWDADGWVVLCLDDIAGSPPQRPWLGSELRAAVDTVTAMSRLLTPAPDGLQLPTWREELGGFPAYWERFDPQGEVAEHGEEIRELAQSGLIVGGGDTLVHCDLRDDNLIVDDAGKMWVCDWNWPVLGAEWVDLLTLLISARGDGHDVDALLVANPLTCDVPSSDVDRVLALLAVYFLGAKEGETPATSPWLRVHQRWYANVTWSWLAERRGWR
ncbi:MAG: phosphotransferase [Nocardioidaceae bacterium]|nr:phosphotransferase [Nocardioidaceae bacterium]